MSFALTWPKKWIPQYCRLKWQTRLQKMCSSWNSAWRMTQTLPVHSTSFSATLLYTIFGTSWTILDILEYLSHPATSWLFWNILCTLQFTVLDILEYLALHLFCVRQQETVLIRKLFFLLHSLLDLFLRKSPKDPEMFLPNTRDLQPFHAVHWAA